MHKLDKKQPRKSIAIGFTGTQQGLSQAQVRLLKTIFLKQHVKNRTIKLLHGDCIGADEQAHKILINTEVYKDHPELCVIEKYPCTIENKRAHTEEGKCVYKNTGLLLLWPPLERNRVIVDNSDIMIACPYELTEQLRSGTWATIRYARNRTNKKLIILYRNGDVTVE